MIIDGILKEWGDRLNYGQVQGRTGRNISGGAFNKTPTVKKPRDMKKVFSATIRRVPEVMVKISGGGKDMRSIKSHFDYISRNGALELEDDQGRLFHGKDDVRELRDNWKGFGIPYEDGQRREAFNIILSMPPGTDRESVKNAAREFAGELFSEHDYVFVAHEDEKHPHIHLCVKAVNHDGIRLNPRKADLQNWRETFVDKLSEYGIEANATPRQLRGIVKKAERQPLRHMRYDHLSRKRKELPRVYEEQINLAKREAVRVEHHSNPAHESIRNSRLKLLRQLDTMAKALVKGNEEEKDLVVKLAHFCRDLPPLKTRHDERVEWHRRDLKRDYSAERRMEIDREKTQEKDQGLER